MDSSQHPLEKMISGNKSFKPSEHTDIDDAAEDKPKTIELIDQEASRPTAIDLSGIDRPALLINSKLKIAWQNRMAVDQIWHNAGSANSGSTSPHLFDLLFNPIFKRKVANFSNCLEFFLNQLCAVLPEDQLRNHVHQMDDERKDPLLSLLGQSDWTEANSTISSGSYRQTLINGKNITFDVMAANFREGRLLIFESRTEDGNRAQVQRAEKARRRFVRIHHHPNPIRKSYILLAAQLNDASTLRMEMLSDEYWRLMNGLSQRCLHTIESYGGVFVKLNESGFMAYFISDTGDVPDPLGVIDCGLEMKARMMELGREWKIRKDWFHDIELNMGLHWEEAYIGTLSTSAGDLLTSFGAGTQMATTLSQLAESGQIWASKAMIDKIPPEKLKRLRFGIQRQESPGHHRYIRNGFARMKDIFGTAASKPIHDESSDLLPITQIFDLEAGTPS